MLTDRTLRLEYDPSGEFEDRPSQAFWYREQPVPPYQVAENEDGAIEIETAYLHVCYLPEGTGFTNNNLAITLKESNTTWHYDQADPLNLKGTTRTLDNVDGALPLEMGLISRSGWSVYNDSDSLVFNQDGWLETRQAHLDYKDIYFFAYGQDYQACLTDFTRLSGPAPMIPRWALGVWWSRYWAYSADELLGVVDEFAAHQVPLSVCIVDMDWHTTGRDGGGWTGYTWNRELFPEPEGFIAALHDRGLKTALNLHPADGVHHHEEQYLAMAVRLGHDNHDKKPIPFRIADPQFTRAYFEILHHPEEAKGVDFWWLDWQQGTASDLSGLDPLWWLNHLHFYDLGRSGQKRPFIFSRWGGLGNHRYPIGFSGDTVVSWQSLAFQPYFTASAANVNYGWWSHDIGGHMGGIEDSELYARWVQFGVFSPILRLHSTNNRFHERRPWGHDAETERAANHALRLRHSLIPYIYSMAWRNHTESTPLIRPIYHQHADDEPAYHCPDQYFFGSELIAAPFTKPADVDTRLSRQVVWLPQGEEWYDFFSGSRYPSNCWHAVYGELDEIPVIAKAGAIVPLTPDDGQNKCDNPDTLAIHCFPGADNEFKLYEDDGLHRHALTTISQRWSPQKWQIRIDATEGGCEVLPANRTYQILLRGVLPHVTVSATCNAKTINIETAYRGYTQTLEISGISVRPQELLTLSISPEDKIFKTPQDYQLRMTQKMVRAFRLETNIKSKLFAALPNILNDFQRLADYELDLTSTQRRALAEVITGAGWHRYSHYTTGNTEIHNTDTIRYKLSAQDMNRQPESHKGTAPQFAVLTIGRENLSFHKGSQPTQGRVTLAGWFNTLPDRFRKDAALSQDAVVQFSITGVPGHNAYLTINDKQVEITTGQHPGPTVTIQANTPDWLALINGEVSPEELFLGGKITVTGDLEFVLSLVDVLHIAPLGKFLPDLWQLIFNYFDFHTQSLGKA